MCIFVSAIYLKPNGKTLKPTKERVLAKINNMKNKELKGISINLSSKKSEDFFHTALCGGLSEIGGYGLELVYDKTEYKLAKDSLIDKIKKGKIPVGMHVYGNKKLTKESICYENVLLEILKIGGKLSLKGNGETKSITLSTVHKRVEKTDLRHLIEYINDTGGDAITADVILQTVFLGEVIYG